MSRKWVEFGLALRLPGGPIHQRRPELIRALQLGEEFGGFRGRGRRAGDPDGPWEDIPREFWIRWKYDEDRGLLHPKTRRRVEIGYVDVEVPLAGVKRLFGLGRPREARRTARRHTNVEDQGPSRIGPDRGLAISEGQSANVATAGSDKFPGRPSLKEPIFEELKKRIDGRLECDTLAAEAHHLFKWARTHYSGDSRLPGKEKSLQNTIRNEYHRLRAERAERDRPTK